MPRAPGHDHRGGPLAGRPGGGQLAGVRRHHPSPGGGPDGRPERRGGQGRDHAAGLLQRPGSCPARRWPRPTGPRWCRSATATATRSTPATAAGSRRSGLVCSGMSPDGRLVEFIELPGHPFWVGTQAHPEFKSRPDRPHPALPRAGGRRPGPGRGTRPPPDRHRCRRLTGQPAGDRPGTRDRRAAAVPADRRGGGPPGLGHHPDPGHASPTPTGWTFERDVVRHPGAVAVVAVTDDGRGGPGAPVPGGGRPVAARAPGRHLRRGGRAGHGGRPPRAGRRGRVRRHRADPAHPVRHHPRVLRRVRQHLPGHRTGPGAGRPPGGRGALHAGRRGAARPGSTPWWTTGPSSTPPPSWAWGWPGGASVPSGTDDEPAAVHRRRGVPVLAGGGEGAGRATP